jgi:hypothetical protein
LSDDVALAAAPLLVTRMVVRAAVIGRTAPVDVYDIAGLRPDACDAVSGSDSDGGADDDHILAGEPPLQRAAASVSADGAAANPTANMPQGAGTAASPLADAAAAQPATEALDGAATSGVRRARFLRLVRWHARRHPVPGADPSATTDFCARATAAAKLVASARFGEAAKLLQDAVDRGNVPKSPEFDAMPATKRLLEVAHAQMAARDAGEHADLRNGPSLRPQTQALPGAVPEDALNGPDQPVSEYVYASMRKK